MTVALLASAFHAARAAVTLAACRDTDRPILCGVHIVARDGHLIIEATDSYRLHHIDIPGVDGDEFDVLVDARWLKAVRLPTHGRRLIDVAFALGIAGRFTVVCDTDQWSTACIDVGDTPYPDTPKFLGDPTHDPDVNGVAFNPRYYADAMEASAKWAGIDNGPVRVHVTGALTPCRFVTFRKAGDVDSDARLDVALMPVRT